MKITRRCFALLLLAFLLFPAALPASAQEHSYIMFVGTYTDGSSHGIYGYRFEPAKGEFIPLGLLAETKNPSFLVIHPNRKYLYAVNEVGDFAGQKNSGGVSAFSLDEKTGKLTLLNQVSSRGADPAYITIDKSGHYVLVANYTGGSVASFPILADGRLGEASSVIQHVGKGADPERQEAPHAHSINLSPDNRFAITADLGLDELISYKFSARDGTLSKEGAPILKLDAKAGPRHFTFDPSGKFGYVIAEMQSSVTALAYNSSNGSFRRLQTISTLPPGYTGKNDDAEVRVHPNGRFVYASNRGHDSIAVFQIDRAKGTLKQVQDVPTQGKDPRNFAIDPSGHRLIVGNHHSGTIVVFNLDPATGKLTPSGKVLQLDSPVCFRFLELR